MTVKDEVDRPLFFIRARKGVSNAEATRDLTGELLLQRHGKEQTLAPLAAAEPIPPTTAPAHPTPSQPAP